MKARDLLPTDHPLRAAKWIWPENYLYLHNHFAHFRRDFDLADVPSAAPLFITADQSYRLYVNGRHVTRGPARGFQAHWPYDEVDLAPFLRVGHNWLAVEGYNPGTGTFQYVHQSQAGLLVAARWGETCLRSGDAGWSYHRAPGFRTQTARYSVQLNYQEDIDLALAEHGWIEAETPPAPRKLGSGRQQHFYTDVPFGRPPWESVEPRGIPPLRETWLAPVGISATATGASDADYAQRENLSWGWAREGGRVAAWESGAVVPCRHETDAAGAAWLLFELAPTGVGNWRAVTLALEAMTVGTVAFTVEQAVGGEILDFQHDQNLRAGHPIFIPEGVGSAIALANRARLRPGANAHEFFHPLGFRHITVIGRDLTRPLTVRLRVRTALYPFTMRGRFACSDETLNRIHAISRHTQQLCSLDAYVDTPWREQAQWWGDARVQARNTFYLDGDPRLLARGIRQIGAQRTREGLTYGHAPTVAYSCILPDFALTWILTLYDYWWQTGKLALFREQWTGIRQVLAYFDTPEARAPSGLLRYDRRFWLFEDWATLSKCEIPTFLNLWYLYTLRHLLVLLDAAGKTRDAAHLRTKMAELERQVVATLHDPQTLLFRDGLDEQGTPLPRYSAHEQVLALALGLTPGSHATMLAERVLPYLRDEPFEGARPSAFWCTYLFEEAARAGHAGEVLAFIRRHWEPMLSTGTTWEDFKWDETAGGSCSHAWTAHPAYHLVNLAAGLTQSGLAWSRVRFAPDGVSACDHAAATVPSPRGLIEASWERRDGTLRARLALPRGVTAEVALPDGSSRMVTGKGVFTF